MLCVLHRTVDLVRANDDVVFLGDSREVFIGAEQVFVDLSEEMMSRSLQSNRENKAQVRADDRLGDGEAIGFLVRYVEIRGCGCHQRGNRRPTKNAE